MRYLISRRQAIRNYVAERGDERGSLIIAITIALVLMMLSSLLVALVIGNEDLIVSRQKVFSGVNGADAGLSDALFRLDQGTSDAGNNGVMCYNPALAAQGDANCSVTAGNASPQLTGIEYVARTVPAGTAPAAATEWIVQAIGNASTGFHGAVQETLTRSSKYPFALFGKQGLTFTGNTQGGVNFGSYTAGAPGVGTYTPCNDSTASPPCLLLGSDGSISCSGPSPAGVEGIIFATGSGGGSDSCGTATSRNSVYQVPDPILPPGSQTCPNGGNLGSGYGYPNIPPGVYNCTSTVNISGTLAVSPATGPAQLYIMTGSSTSNFLAVAGGSQINTTIPVGSLTNSGPPSGSTLPNSQLFQVFTNSNGNLTSNGNSNSFIFAGVLYAPDAYLTNNGCQSEFLGTVTINTYTCHGGPNLSFWYDNTLSTDFGAWQVSGYQQINPSAVQFP